MNEDEQRQQEYYRDARTTGQYDKIWQTVGKCIFCTSERDQYNILEENGLVLTINVFAYIDGHLMIVPRKHIASVKELTPSQWETARKMMYLAKKLIREVHGVKGMQTLIRDGGIVAQSTVSDHLHIHCIPFDAPDLSVWNYRKLKYTPVENTALYKKHAKKIAKLSQKFTEKYGGKE